MTEDDKFYYWKKGTNPKLSNNFHGSEFDCQCRNEDCVDQKISKELIKILQDIRNVMASSIKITSGFRCAKQQQSLRDRGVNTVVAKKSAHEDGLACDMYAPSVVFKEFYTKYVEPRFYNLGKALSFVHVDMRPKKLDGKKRLWNY
jgi:uncharacterized protein YcbK (DUF882 family)